MTKSFKEWAEYYSPNTVVYQIGYESDYKIWSQYANPVQEIGSVLAEGCSEDQHCGIIWVDFTLKKMINKLK